jgi:hypothetical protein
MQDSFFKTLTPEQEIEFRQWARDNYDPIILPDPVWHPVIRDEMAKIKLEKAKVIQ